MMMDFDNILDLATQNQGGGGLQRRYSLQTGPPKKDARSKGVNPAAVQALLKKKHLEAKKKEQEMKKQKDGLLAKRVELKSDRKARAMASRTKDNFHGYNGIPVVEGPKKRRTKQEMQQSNEEFRNDTMDPEDDEDNYEYEQTDSESERESAPLKPFRPAGGGSSSGKLSSKKPGGPSKAPQPGLNFADLLKLAEKKQFEPVDLKPKKVKKEERLRTAEEIRELEMERKARRPDKDRDGKPQSNSGLVKKSTLEKEQRNSKPQKSSSLSSSSGKKSHPTQGFSQPKSAVSDREREKAKKTHVDRDKPKTSASSSSSTANTKVPPKAASSQASSKQAGPKVNPRPSTSSDLSSRKESPSLLSRKTSGIPATKNPGAAGGSSQKSQQARPPQVGPSRLGQPAGGVKAGRGEPLRPGSNAVLKSGANSRPASGGPARPGGPPQARPGTGAAGGPLTKVKSGGLQGHLGGSGPRPQGTGPGRPGGSTASGPGRPGGSTASGPGRPGGGAASGPGRPGGATSGPGRPLGSCASGPGRPGGSVSGPGKPLGSAASGPGRPGNSAASGPGRPRCTVVSETISSKNVGGMRPGGPYRPGMPPRPMMNRPPVPMLPPITSAYKRKYEDEEEYDSEMDDFIDDEGDNQDEISKHIREIFGYDRNKYKDESDYALKFMESSWKDMQKEEARSLRMAVQEDLEEEKRELEELKKQNTKRRKT